jgi:hypothetical protein
MLDPGSYVVAIIASRSSYDSLLVTVSHDEYANLLAQCTLIYGPGH